MNRLEVSAGSRSYALLGAGLGFVVGAGSTYYLTNSGGSTGLCNQRANQDAIDAPYCLGIYGLGGLVGAGMGAFIGSRIRTERWQSVAPGRVRIGSYGRLGLVLTVAM